MEFAESVPCFQHRRELDVEKNHLSRLHIIRRDVEFPDPPLDRPVRAPKPVDSAANAVPATARAHCWEAGRAESTPRHWMSRSDIMSESAVRRSDPKQYFPDCSPEETEIMKRATSLLAVAMLTATSVGCNCCPCLRNLCPLGVCSRLCSPSTTYAPAPVATYAAVPASPCAPAPVYAAAPATPVYAAPQQYTVPQYAAPQYAVAAPQPVYSEAGCGSSYAAAAPCANMRGFTLRDKLRHVVQRGRSLRLHGRRLRRAGQQQIVVDPSPAP